MNDYAGQIGALTTDVDRAKSDITRLYTANKDREQEHTNTLLKFNDIQHMVEETNTMTAGIAETMEEFKKTVTESIDGLGSKVSNLDSRISTIESKQFDWAKFMRGAITPKGMILIAMFLVAFTTICLSIFSPESLPAFYDFVRDAKT